MSLPELTLGIEEEYQIIDPVTRELHPSIEMFLEKGQAILGDQIKAELMQSQVEVGTVVCRNLKEARQELVRLRKTICELADQNGMKVAAASTHPFSAWKSQVVTEDDRYLRLRDDHGEIARRLLICGMHVHIGISDRELMIDVMNQALYFMPHILAISTSSPFWHGRKTELKSYRSVVFENLPRTGLPPMFNSYAEFERVVAILVDTNTIEDASKIWWDVRPHHKFPTLEFRIADICTRVDEALCVAALIQSIVAKLMKLRRNNQTWRRYPRHLINENKWRAVKRGIEGQLIDFGKRKEVPVRFLALELMEFIDDVVDELGARSDVEYLNTILKHGTSADRQLAIYEETGSFEAVVDNLIKETREGCA
jgi:carboxylate-amine ligase